MGAFDLQALSRTEGEPVDRTSEECEAFPVSALVNSARHDVLFYRKSSVPDQTDLFDSV
jgi:hypothetical protein